MTTTTAMMYRRFGRTELQMPVFSCGGMRYQQGWQDMPLDQVQAENQRNLEATIDRALQVGINHIETARGYGSSERQLGQVLPRRPRDAMIVQTKVGPEKDAKRFIENFDDSLSRLRLDHVDLLAIHGINNHQKLDWSIKPGGCFEAAQRLREQGKCRFIGFSTHGPLEVILEAIHFGQPRVGEGFDYLNLHWYYINRWNQPAIDAAAARDMGVFIISPSDKGGKLYDPPDKLCKLCSPLHPITFNDAWCLQNPKVHTLSVGAARPTDFDEHLDALEHIDRYGEVAAAADERLCEAYNAAIEPELRCVESLGLPQCDSSPGGMNLPTILWLRNLAKAWGMDEFARMRYNLLGNGGDWFAGYKADKLHQPYVEQSLRRMLEDHPHRAAIMSALREADQLLGGAEVKRLSQGG